MEPICHLCGCNIFRIFVALCCNKLQSCNILFLPCCATAEIQGTGPKIRFWEWTSGMLEHVEKCIKLGFIYGLKISELSIPADQANKI
jgi:hypothetical protein